CVAGSFNDWQPVRLQLADAEGSRWEIEVALPVGTHEYLFVVDERWVADPNNPNTVPNPFGGVNSVVEVRAPAARRPRRSSKPTP
ncbi:MAG TPA: hypothetical protein DCE44_12330, partial [Verrucomicrobiales bacterium]|nr:hypothetical protein [Verrucomicrobiales bacterium]